MTSDRTARKTFHVVKTCTSDFNVTCNLCDWERKAWDWKRNALAVGYGHSFLVHDIKSPRGVWVATQTTLGGATLDDRLKTPVS